MTPDLSWHDEAVCRQIDPEIFYPENTRSAETTIAKRICGSCPVQWHCLQWALHHERHGVWGGMTPFERMRVGGLHPRRVAS